MSSVLRATGATVVTALGTVNTLANRSSQFINTTASALDMLDSFVQKARTKQVASDRLEMLHYLEKLQLQTAADHSEFQQEIKRKVETNKELSTLYAANLQRLNPVMEELRSELNLPAFTYASNPA